MANMTTSGLNELSEMLKELGELDNGELTGNMLNAGAEVVADEWKKGIKNVVIPGGRSKGDMENSVAPSKKIERKGDISATTIYPQGKDRKGVRNAEKAFILHYGKSGQMGTRFVDNVEANAEDAATEAMEEVFNEFLNKKGAV